jgi:hypothetical protein
LAGLSVEIGETTERVLILVGQLEEASLSLMMVREEEVIIVLRVGCTICSLMFLRVYDEGT